MSELVADNSIERIVGAPRHRTEHQARAISSEQTVYVLHSQQCRDSGVDLRQCRYSLALDNGIWIEEWVEDIPVLVRIIGAFSTTRLAPDPRRVVLEWVVETYKPDGVNIWLASYRDGDAAHREHLARMASTDAMGT